MNRKVIIFIVIGVVLLGGGLLAWVLLGGKGNRQNSNNGGGGGCDGKACNEEMGATCCTGYTCENYKCQRFIDPCAGVVCSGGQKCVNGTCKTVVQARCIGGIPREIVENSTKYMCKNKSCNQDKICVNGNCVKRNPIIEDSSAYCSGNSDTIGGRIAVDMPNGERFFL